MERVGTLINKLKEQFEQQADTEKLSVTARLLLAELQLYLKQSQVAAKGKVSVVLPTVAYGGDMVTETSTRSIAAAVVPVQEKVAAVAAGEQNGWLYKTPVEIPTVAHQAEREVYELNDVMHSTHEVLNERLREEKIEVATILQAAPVRDLKKAVGINDRYLFVNDLFRGDESMYERCLKTINSFNIYPEAQYWIQRELKVKMGWNDNSETVKLFDQLVRRRFS